MFFKYKIHYDSSNKPTRKPPKIVDWLTESQSIYYMTIQQHSDTSVSSIKAINNFTTH